MLRKTRIICTQGPTTEREGVVEALIENGMNCASFNFSHGDHESHLYRINMVREAAKKTGAVVSLILDTKGPEMRLGDFSDGPVYLDAGQRFILTNDGELGDKSRVSVSYKNLYQEVKPGNTLLLADGLVALKVDAIEGENIITTVQNSGRMSDKKRIAAPGVALNLPPISAQDERDIIFGCEQGLDFVAASFIQRAEDVKAIRELIKSHNGKMEILSKIENLTGVKNFDDILDVSDGIMVARGDLGVEIPAEDVPIIQKEIVKKCNRVGKPVIVATQMLESMTDNPRPTRAEVSDVGNAVLDGADAIMLSGETANGKYPVEAVATMAKIAKRMEEGLSYRGLLTQQGIEKVHSRTRAIAHATVQMAYELEAAAIITPSLSGYTTEAVSRFRPKAAIIAYTPNEEVLRKVNLRWGVYPILGKMWEGPDNAGMIKEAADGALSHGYVKPGDYTIVTAGIKSEEGNTNSIRVHVV